MASSSTSSFLPRDVRGSTPGVVCPFDLMPYPDWAATTTIAVAKAAGHTPERWAQAICDFSAMPSWVKAMFALRAVAATRYACHRLIRRCSPWTG